ncbi:hypothetical protein JVU11DRAFT_869 [Chiua virens]|nr:hypothetical protein JVU11DRAFT_869 [Chiua virens]
MNSHTRRRDDRPAADPYKQWLPTADKYPPDYDSERRRNRSATLPAHPYDPKSYPSNDPRYNDPRQPPSRRQDPLYPSTAPSAHPSYHHSSAPIPSTSKAYQHATRPSAQHSSSGYHYPQPSSYQPSHSTPAYPIASSSRRPHPDAPDPRASRRPAAPTHHPSYEYVSSGEEMSRAPRHSARPTHSSAQPPLSATANQQFWNPPQDMSSSRRHKDPYRDRDRDHERERDRDKDKEREREQRDRDRERERDKERDRDRDKPEPEIKYKDRTRPERHRERATEVRHQEPTRSKHHDKRKDSDTEGVIYPEQRNASKVSLTGREGYPSRESASGHKRHRTEDGTASVGRRLQPENTQNPITTMPSQPTNVPPLDAQQTGEPPPAPRVMPVYLPPKAKSQRSHREGRPSTAQGAQSGSDTERATGKHRMDRTPSGPGVQRSDPYTSSSTRERANHDASTGPRDDVKRIEGKYGAQHDSRQPLAPINVDIPLVTPGFNASALPSEARIATAPQRVSIRAGQGPSDPHDAYSKSSTTPHPDAPQEVVVHPPASASIVKSSSHTPSRLQPSDTRPQYDRPAVVEQSRTEPHGYDLPPGQRMSTHESSRVLPTSISKSHSYARGNPETAADNTNSSYPHSRPPSRSAHRTANNIVPPAVVGPRPLRSVSQGPQTNEPSTRPPSVAQYAPTVNPAQTYHSVPPSPGHVTNSSPPRTENAHVPLLSAHPSPKNAPQLHGVSLSHNTSIQQAPSVSSTAHPTPIAVPQLLTTSSRPSTRDGAHTDAPPALQQTTERRSMTDDRQGLRQASNGTTVKTSWVVQTPATAKKTRISREDKYLPRHNINSETPHPQLRQVLSQDSDPFPRTSSSMMKASQATTPTTSSQRNSPGARTRESFGTPRGTMASGSPKSWSAKEVISQTLDLYLFSYLCFVIQAPTPEHIPRPTLPPHIAGPPQIAVVGATPITSARELPQGRVDYALLAPPFPAPTRASRTTSNSQDQQSQPPQPVVRTASSSSSQPPPPVHAPSLFQPYRPPSLSPAEDTGKFSPPPLPIPPPRGPEDYPPLIETRTSEIIRTRSHHEEHPQTMDITSLK